ncbi:MAG: hypothetical protein KGL39_29200 [Patescibacteria group bacterium]|nr:hypothetical protein [Patescibacteria group bacterium]
MKRFAIALAFALAACSGAGNPPPVPAPSPTPAPPCTSAAARINHQLDSVLPHIMRVRFDNVVQSTNLAYNGGAVLVKPVVYLDLWGFAPSDPVAQRLISLYSSVGGSEWLSTVSQYCQKPNVYIQNPTGMLAQVWSDTDNPVPHAPTQAQIAAEAKVVAARFGIDESNASVVVAMPHGVVPAGFGISYCAWHNNDGNLSYTNMPYIPDAGSGCGAGLDGDPLAGVSIVAGHEYAESITDPQPPSGWSIPSGEIGDLCAWQDIKEVSLNGVSFPMQPLYSNEARGCVQ